MDSAGGQGSEDIGAGCKGLLELLGQLLHGELKAVPAHLHHVTTTTEWQPLCTISGRGSLLEGEPQRGGGGAAGMGRGKGCTAAPPSVASHHLLRKLA